MRWQKVARVVVAAIGLASAFAVYHYTRSRPAPADPPKSLATIGSNVAQTTEKCHWDITRPPPKALVTVDCAASETLTDGRFRLKQVVIGGLNGAAFVMRGDLLEADQLSAGGLPPHTLVTGHVRITTDDGLELLSDQATYDDAAGLLTMPGAVTFTRGRLSGTSMGATYERDADTIKLLDKATARVAADPAGKGSANATATRMNLKRGQHTLRMEGNARVVGDTQTMTGNEATWTFTENEQAVKYVELRGAARVFPNVRGNTDQATMNADNITMTFGPDGLTLQHARLMGSAALEMAGSAPRTIRASLIDFVLGPDGRLVTKLDANDQVTVTLAATPTASGRTITATTLAATGDDKKGLTRAQFDGNPVFRQDPAAVPARGAASGSAAGSRRGSATRLVLTLGGQIDAIEFAEFQQNAKFDDGDVHGEADVAKYDEAKQTLHLTPNDRAPRKLSTVKTPDMKVDAWTIDVATESQDLMAKGAVITRTTPKASAGAPAGSLFGGKDDIIGSAESFTYTKIAGRAVYTGTPAKLWQGDPKVEAEEIVYFDKTQSLTASRRVDSTWVLDPAAGDKPGTPMKTYKVRADKLTYDDAARTAVYEGSTVYLHSADGDVEARKMTFRLAAASRTLDEMRAEQDVYAQLSGGNEAVSEVLVFDAGKDAYTLLGVTGRNAKLKSTGSRPDNSSSTQPQCTLTESMQIQLDRRTNHVDQPTGGQAPKPSTPIGCAESIRRSR